MSVEVIDTHTDVCETSQRSQLILLIACAIRRQKLP